MAETGKKTCYISAPFGFDAFPLMQALTERNVTSTRLDDLALGESIITGVQREIRRADFVCVVLSDGYRQNNVVFEAGLALGKGRPVLILAESDVDIPFELAQLKYVRTSLSDKQVLGGVLDAYLPGLLTRTQGRRKLPAPAPKLLGQEDAETLLRVLRDPNAVSEERLGDFVAEIFRKVGILASPSHSHGAEQGPDLAIWVDEIQSIFGNPIFVEIKAGRLSQTQIDDSYHQLSQHLIRAKLLLGIIIYWDAEGRKFKVAAANLPLVVSFSIEELIDSLRLGTFTKTLIAIRNRAVHGVVA